MTTRTKLALCAGLLAVAVGVVVVFRSPGKPDVEMKFMRYEQDGAAILTFTNRGRSSIGIHSPMLVEGRGLYLGSAPIKRRTLPPEQGMEVSVAQVFQPSLQPVSAPVMIAPSNKVSVVYTPYRFGSSIETLLGKIGIDLASPGFDVSVTLPPRGSNAPAQPVTP